MKNHCIILGVVPDNQLNNCAAYGQDRREAEKNWADLELAGREGLIQRPAYRVVVTPKAY